MVAGGEHCQLRAAIEVLVPYTLEQVTEGPWKAINELVVIEDALYRLYIAALIAYWSELEDRIRSRLNMTPQVDITLWRTMVPAGG